MEVGELISRQHCFKSEDRIYHVAIIDYLQSWTFNKKMERLLKTQVKGKDGGQLSAIEPNLYATRFKLFMETYIFN